MSTGVLVGAFASGAVWLGVLTLVAMGWVDERHREDDEAFGTPRPTARERASANRYNTPEAHAGIPPTVAPPTMAPPTMARPTMVTPPATPAPPAEPTGVVHQAPPEAPGFWQIQTLQNGEGS